MTAREAIEVIKSECYVVNALNFDRTTMVNTALDIAVKSLEQEPVIDKIRAEIENHRRKTMYIDYYDLVGDCLDIIDKCRQKVSDKKWQ